MAPVRESGPIDEEEFGHASDYHNWPSLLKSGFLKKIPKDYGTPEEFLTDCENALKTGGWMLVSKENVDSRQMVEVKLSIATKEIGQFQAEAVYVAPTEGGFTVGLELKGEWQKALKEVKTKLPKAGDEKWGSDSESLYHAVMKMQTHEKIQLAIKGNREERRVLMKDNHYMVHAYVLKNPRITTEEVSHFARMPSITSEMLKTITDNTEWMNNSTVKLAIVKNPKTPANIVQKYIGNLGDNDLMQMAKSGNVKDAVAKMAVKVLASRGKVVR
jgi:hypothetical protein